MAHSITLVTAAQYRKKRRHRSHLSPRSLLTHFPVLYSTCLTTGHPYYFSPRRASLVSPLPAFEFVTRFSYTRFQTRRHPFHGPTSISTLATSSSGNSLHSDTMQILLSKGSPLPSIAEGREGEEALPPEASSPVGEDPFTRANSPPPPPPPPPASIISSPEDVEEHPVARSRKCSGEKGSAADVDADANANANAEWKIEPSEKSRVEGIVETSFDPSGTSSSASDSIQSTLRRRPGKRFAHLRAARKLFSLVQSDEEEVEEQEQKESEELAIAMNSLTLGDGEEAAVALTEEEGWD